MKDSSVFLHELYSPGGVNGLAALKNAPNTHPQEWANRNPYTMVSILKHAWSFNLPDLANWAVENIPPPIANFFSLLPESLKHENTHVTDFLLAEFEIFTEQQCDVPKSLSIGLSAALAAAEIGDLQYLKKINHIMRHYFLCDQFERIAGSGAAHTDVVQYLWNDLSEPGHIQVASLVVCANNIDVIEWIAQRIPSSHWADVEWNLDEDQKSIWRAHTAVVQRGRLEEQTPSTIFSTPSKKI